MFANFLIGLREGLEACLVVSILIAYLVKTGRRDRLAPIWLGVAAAVTLSVTFGAFLQLTSTSLLRTSASREVFGGCLSIIAVAFVTWMVFWMRRTARSMRAELDGKLASAVGVGALAVGLTGFLAVGREGLETATFFWTAAQQAGNSATPLVGFSLGLTVAVVLAWLLYRRAVSINLARFFTWTGVGLVVVAAGVLGYGVHDLQEGGVLPSVGSTLAWSAPWLADSGHWYGALGTLVKSVFNIGAEMTWPQVGAYLAYLVPVLALFLGGSRGRVRAATPTPGPAAAMPATAVPATAPAAARTSVPAA